MQPENKTSDPQERSFIEKARRAQIIACAIDTIATHGYAKASLAQIARRAGISKGVISYHFAGKDELIQQVVAEVLATGVAYMRPRIEAESTMAGRLRTYIESNVDFMRTHPNHIAALVEVVSHARAPGNPSAFLSNWFETAVGQLEQLLQAGQKAGEFRAFSPRVMAIVIRNAIDGVPAQLAAQADLDLHAYAQELVTLFARATRPDE